MTRNLILFFAILACPLVDAAEATVKIYSRASQVYPLQSASLEARSSAMGAAMVAVGEGEGTIMHNPAGLGSGSQGGLGLSHNSLFLGASQQALLARLPLSETWGGLGLRADHAELGSLEAVDADGRRQGDLSVSETHGGLAWGASLLGAVALGFGVRFTQQSVGASSGQSLGLDAGLLWQAIPGLRLGLAAQGSGGPASAGQRYWLGRGGLSFSAPFGRALSLMAATEAGVDAGGLAEIRAGLEAQAFELLCLRGGMRTPMDEKGEIRTSLGLGLAWREWGLDYAWLPGGLQALHQFSLCWRFGGPADSQGLGTGAAGPPYPEGIFESPVGPGPESASFSGQFTEEQKSEMTETPMEGLAETPSPLPVSESAGASLPELPAPPADLGPAGEREGAALHAEVLSDHASQGLSLESQQRGLEAFQEFLAGALLDPRDTQCWRGMARAYQARGQLDHARTCWQRVRVLDPGALDARAWLEREP